MKYSETFYCGLYNEKWLVSACWRVFVWTSSKNEMEEVFYENKLIGGTTLLVLSTFEPSTQREKLKRVSKYKEYSRICLHFIEPSWDRICT